MKKKSREDKNNIDFFNTSVPPGVVVLPGERFASNALLVTSMTTSLSITFFGELFFGGPISFELQKWMKKSREDENDVDPSHCYTRTTLCCFFYTMYATMYVCYCMLHSNNTMYECTLALPPCLRRTLSDYTRRLQVSSTGGFLMYTIFAPVHPVLSKQNAPRRHPYGRHLWGGAFNKKQERNYFRTPPGRGVPSKPLLWNGLPGGRSVLFDSRTCVVSIPI